MSHGLRFYNYIDWRTKNYFHFARLFFYLRALTAAMMIRMIPPELSCSFAEFWIHFHFSRCRMKILILDEVAKYRTKVQKKSSSTRTEQQWRL